MALLPFLFVCFLRVVFSSTPQFTGPLSALPSGYRLNAAITVNNPSLQSYEGFAIAKGSIGTLAGLNTGIDKVVKPFLGDFPSLGLAGVAMADNDFYVTPTPGSYCSNKPLPYPKKGQHALCLALKGSPKFDWKCPWASSYYIPKHGGCDNFIIDCSDTDRIDRIIAKYDWIASQGVKSPNGPEMHCLDCNTYAQACVRHQCRQGPDPGPVPVVKRLYEVGPEVENGATGSTTLVIFFDYPLSCCLIVLVGIMLIVGRRTIYHRPSTTEQSVMDNVDQDLE